MASTYTLISSQVLGSSAATVTFSSIPSTYKDLVLRCSTRDDAAGTSYYQLYSQFNNDTAGNYSVTALRGDGSAAISLRSTGSFQNFLGYDDTSVATTNTFASAEMYLPNYTTTSSVKPFASFSAHENNVSTPVYIFAGANLWNSTAAITTWKIFPGSGNFVTGSSFYLYGI